MTFEIYYSKAADRDLSKLPNEVIKKIVYAIGDIRKDPDSSPKILIARVFSRILRNVGKDPVRDPLSLSSPMQQPNHQE